MFYLLSADSELVSNWVAEFFPIFKFILLVLILLFSVALIVVVMMQESEGSDTTNAITGIKDTYYKKNKGLNKEARLKRATIILSVCIAIFTIVFFVTTKFGYAGSLWS